MVIHGNNFNSNASEAIQIVEDMQLVVYMVLVSPYFNEELVEMIHQELRIEQAFIETCTSVSWFL